MEIDLLTGRGVFQVLAHVSRSPLEALRQFVENAADAIEQGGVKDGHIMVHLVEGEGELKEVAVEDNGAGISLEKMEQVLRSVGHSEKVDSALRGEKGIGILAFTLIAQEVHLNSRSESGGSSACLVLRQEGIREGKGEVLSPCPHHARVGRGTTAHLRGIFAEAAPSFTWKHLKEYLGREFSGDLRRKVYDLVLEVGGHWEPVHPQRFRGLSVVSQKLPLASSGHAVVEMYVLPVETPDAAIDLYGRGGVRICSLSALEPFQLSPWQDRRLEGYIRCDRLTRTADKTGVVQDRAYWDLVDALKALEPHLKQEMTRVDQEYLERRLGRVLRRVDGLVERFLLYLEEGAPLIVSNGSNGAHHGNGTTPSHPSPSRETHSRRGGQRPRFQPAHFNLAEPADTRKEWGSWANGGEELVYVNTNHPDFLEARKEDARWGHYLFALWAKEHLLTEYGSDARKVAELLVSWLNKADPLLGRLRTQ